MIKIFEDELFEILYVLYPFCDDNVISKKKKTKASYINTKACVLQSNYDIFYFAM